SVLLKSKSGRTVRVRALLDQGSQASFVTESVVQLLKAERKNVDISVSGIGGTKVGKIKGLASFTAEPCSCKGPVLPIKAFVMQKLTAYTPSSVINDDTYTHLKAITLADSEPSDRRHVDLLIGTDHYGAILRDGLIRGPSGGPIAQLTIFGWVVSGPARKDSRNPSMCVNHVSSSDDLTEVLSRFWELEEIPRRPMQSDEDLQCEEHFVKTHSRLPDGQYVVKLPFKSKPPIPIDTEKIAKRIFLSNEIRVSRQPELQQAYNDFMKEYEVLNHMEKVPIHDKSNRQKIYLPHHAVLKESSATTKLRVVFNASRASTNGSTLNDHLLVGPKLQNDLFALILRWRSHKFVYSADIEKMFRQIRVCPSNTDYQRIFWRADHESDLHAYRLLTVIYGTAPAPFLANRVLKQLAVDEGAKFPLAVPILENEIYVDDLMFGTEDLVILRQTRTHLTQLLKAGGFRPYKWASNDSRLLKDIPLPDLGQDSEKRLGDETNIKVLGIARHPSSDSFNIKAQVTSETRFTKRSFLSLLARTFDPLGWVAPVTVTAKILMQVLWLNKIEWDDPLPVELLRRCQSYHSQLTDLNKISISRWTGQGSDPQDIEIHGFSDASNVAYAAQWSGSR
ncbi:PREDICTED: uncharacterized protein LOC105568275, partial [Vollenhovia emeryi]|uniref:uncharacterized protein LOC105568275 n=1 Tax=Vollenhovia emeryi TaxID=411798 RepID=UPI0005F52C0C